MFPPFVELLALGYVFWFSAIAVLITLCVLADYEQPVFCGVLIIAFLALGGWWTSGEEHRSLFQLAPAGWDAFWFLFYFAVIGLSYGSLKTYLYLQGRKNDIKREISIWERRGMPVESHKEKFLEHLYGKGLVSGDVYRAHRDGDLPKLDLSPDLPALANKFATWTLFWFASMLVSLFKDLTIWLYHASIDAITRVSDRMFRDLNTQLSLTDEDRNPPKGDDDLGSVRIRPGMTS